MIKKVQGNLSNKLSNPFYSVIIFSVIFIIIVGFVIHKTQPQNQLLKNSSQTSENSIGEFQYVRLNTTAALCLDGSPGVYQISKDGDPNKILLFFQGGGWCSGNNEAETLEDCYYRSKTPRGSSLFYSDTRSYTQGIFSKNNRNNFKDWKKVHLLYCDGSGHQGTKLNPVQVKDKQLYFRGHNITVETLEDLEKKIGLFSRSSQIVVSGCSAGGLAAFQWANYITEKVKNAKVRVVADSGIFYDSYNVKTQTPLLRQQYKSLMEIVNKEIAPPVPECLRDNPSQKQKCMFAQNIIKHIKAPVFPIQGLYDNWSIINILGIDCLNYVSLRKCSPIEKYILQENRRNVLSVFDEMKKDPENGVWAPACALHCFTTSPAYYNQNFRIPSGSDNSVSQSVKEWLENPTFSHFYVDQQKWSSNTKCSGINNFV